MTVSKSSVRGRFAGPLAFVAACSHGPPAGEAERRSHIVAVNRLIRNFEDLTRLKSIVEQGSINRAADQLNISQPALNRRVGRLEQRLGLQLLEKSSRGTRPTPQGTLVLFYVQAIERQLAHLATGLQKLGGETEVACRCSCSLHHHQPCPVLSSKCI